MPYKDPEARKEADRLSSAAYRKRHPERARECVREYAKHHREELAVYGREWRKENRDYVREYDRERSQRRERKEQKRKHNRESDKRRRAYIQEKRLKRKRHDIAYQLRCNLRSRLSHAIRHGRKAASAVRDLGCSIEELKRYIAGLFGPGMSWDNWGEWHLDHIKPLASFDLTDHAQCMAACHYTNIRPRWASENLSHGGKIAAAYKRRVV